MSKIYLVTGQKQLFKNELYDIISVKESLRLLNSLNIIQYDSETNGRDSHIGNILCCQFGSKNKFQIVVDTSTIHISLYKNLLENKLIVGHNLKFDLQWLYNYNIIPRKVYDTMVVEQLLYLGYPPYRENSEFSGPSMSLSAVAKRRLGIELDKSIRGEIIWRGLDDRVVLYAAKDVEYLEDIMWSQIADCKKQDCLKGAKLECDFTPVIAYLEWCGIKLDENKWKAKMAKDKESLDNARVALDNFVTSNPSLKKFTYVNLQGDLWEGFDTTPKCTINWSSSQQVILIAKELGFDTKVVDKKTGEDKDSVLEKHLKNQKGINDEFLNLYFDYQEHAKTVTSFGQGHLNAINPNTGRLHTVYRAIGTTSGRMSSGSQSINTDLAKLKGLPTNPSAKQKKEGLGCSYPNMQQLPHDATTRACFVAEKGNLFCSCDYSAMEARIGAEVYNEQMLLDEFLLRSGDTHAAYAKVVFAEELKDVDIKDIKAKRPDLRNKVKAVEFAVQFGSDGTAVAPQLGISIEEARNLVSNLLSGMKGLASFKVKGSKEVREKGYVLLMPQTGHKMYWWDFNKWKQRQASFNSEFWDKYKACHKGTGDAVALEVKQHFQAASKWDRMALNGPTQGGGAIVLKDAMIDWFNWVVDNGYFGKILLVNLTHDECNSEFPEELKDVYPKIVESIMEKSAAKYYHKLPIPAIAEIGNHWIH